MNTKLWIAGIVLLLLVGAAATIQFQHQRIDQLTIDNEDLVQIANDSGRIARTYINLHGRLVNQNKVLKLSARSAEQLSRSEELAWVRKYDGIKKDLRNLEQATRLEATVGVSVVGPNSPPDSIIYSVGRVDSSRQGQTRKFEYLDSYNRIRVVSWPDSTSVTGEISVPIEGVVFWQRKRVLGLRLGRKEYLSEFSSANPWVRITRHELISVRKK
jgi:hypothetical protein